MTKVQCLCTIDEAESWSEFALVRHIKQVCAKHNVSCTHVEELTFELRAPAGYMMRFAQQDFFNVNNGHISITNVPLSPDTCLHRSFF